MISIRTLFLLAIVLISLNVLLSVSGAQNGISPGGLLVWVLLAGLWWVLRRARVEEKRDDAAHPQNAFPENETRMRAEDDRLEGDDELAPDDAPEIVPPPEGAVCHRLPWRVIRQGAVLGRFHNQPIPAWIEAPDGRLAEYTGTTSAPIPDGCRCLEFPERGELVLPPGLVFSLRH